MPTMALVRWAQQAQWTPSRHHMTFLEHRDFSRPEIRALMQFRVRILMRFKSPCNTQGGKEQCGAGSCGGERPHVYDLLKCSQLFPLPSHTERCVSRPQLTLVLPHPLFDSWPLANILPAASSGAGV